VGSLGVLRVEWDHNHRLDGAPEPEAAATRRYRDGQCLYFEECAPWEHASIVIDNHDLDRPFVVERARPAARLAAWALALLVGADAPAIAQDPGFSFAGFGLKTAAAAVAARYPRSTRVGNHVYVRPEESHDHIYGVEMPGDGSRRVRITFERPAGVPSPDGSGRYPTCAQVQRTIERTYGLPASIMEFSEEASWRADRLWQHGTEELRLLCFGTRGRPASLLAEGVLITPVDR
jgi:hypothetical protein